MTSCEAIDCGERAKRCIATGMCGGRDIRIRIGPVAGGRSGRPHRRRFLERHRNLMEGIWMGSVLLLMELATFVAQIVIGNRETPGRPG